jgi:hypothetical protein
MAAIGRRSVQQQNHDTWLKVRDVALAFHSNSQRHRWLTAALMTNSLSHKDGILVSLKQFPEQLGEECEGLWLTKDHRFFQFSILLPRGNEAAIEIEVWREVTAEMPINAHQPGTGKSFAYIALKVLDEIQQS